MGRRKVEIEKLYTQTAYSEKTGISRQLIKYRMNRGELNVVKINGADLIYDDND